MNFDTYLKFFHPGITINDLEISDTPGYWRLKKPCLGYPQCRHPIHRCLFEEGPTYHTISYFDTKRDETGRYISPYATWNKARSM